LPKPPLVLAQWETIFKIIPQLINTILESYRIGGYDITTELYDGCLI